MSDINISEEILTLFAENTENVETDNASVSSETDSDISLSEKIILESNEKRLRNRMLSLQNSINSLKEQLRQEKESRIYDMEKIKVFQKQQLEHNCSSRPQVLKFSENQRCEHMAKTNSIYTLHSCDYCKYQEVKPLQIEKMNEIYNYKRKLAEAETMCNLELLKIKQSIQELQYLQNQSFDWKLSQKQFTSCKKIDETSSETH